MTTSPAHEPRCEVVVSVRTEGEAVLTEEQIVRAVQAVWELEGGPLGAVLEVVLMHEQEHCELHDEFLNDPTPTDVMAFPYEDDDVFGELLINVDMAARVAAEFEHTPAQECTLYVVHGCLHLLGFDDHEEADRVAMRDAEARVMRALESKS